MQELSRILNSSTILPDAHAIILSDKSAACPFHRYTIVKIQSVSAPDSDDLDVDILNGEFEACSLSEPFETHTIKLSFALPAEMVYETTEDWKEHPAGSKFFLFESGFYNDDNDEVVYNLHAANGMFITSLTTGIKRGQTQVPLN